MSLMTGDFPVMADGKIVGNVRIAQDGLMTVFNCACRYNTHDVLRLAAVCDGKYVPLGVMAPEGDFLRLKKSYSKNALLAAGCVDAEAYHLIRPGDIYSAAVPAADEPADAEGGQAEPDATEPVVYNDFPDPAEYVYDFDADDALNEKDSEPAQNPETVTLPLEFKPAESQTAPNVGIMTPKAADGWVPISNPGILFGDPAVQETCDGITNALIKEQNESILLAVPVLPDEPFPMMPVFCFGSSGEIGGQECIIFKIRNGNLTL